MIEHTEKTAEYVVYLRKSRQDIEAEKRGEMETLARHEKILKEVATEQGLNVVKTYKELVSGETIQDRPEMQQMMQEIYAGKYTGVLVVAADRLSRGDLENMGYILNGLKFSSTLLVTPGKTYDVSHNKFDEQMLEMQLFNSKQEYRSITGRMQEGRILSVREGNFIAPHPPYGYDILSPDRWTRTLIPNAQAEIVKDIFSMLVNDRLTCGQIAKKLTQQGVPSPTGKTEWARDSIRNIILNKTYIGKVKWSHRKSVKEMTEDGKIVKKQKSTQNYILVDGKHPAIIDEDTFDIAQTCFRSSVPHKSNTQIINPLSGLLCCAKCGRMLHFHKAHGNNTYDRFRHQETALCKCKSAHYTDVISALCTSLTTHIKDFEFKLNNGDKQEEAKKHTAKMKRVENELEKAKAKRRRLFDDYEEGIYTSTEFTERKTVWANRIKRLANELEELQQTKPKEIDYKEKIVSFSKAVEMLKDDAISAKEKNIFLKTIIEKITYERKSTSRSGGEITLTVFLK